jgi:hypothetical protein
MDARVQGRRCSLWLPVAGLFLWTACHSGTSDGWSGECSKSAVNERQVKISESELTELSGLAASRTNANVLYAHNDSGDSARFFAIGFDGSTLGELRLKDADAVDWEDIAVGPCPQGSCVYLGDIGDNDRNRDSYAVFRVAEPVIDVAQPAAKQSLAWEQFSFHYPNHARYNAETLLVHPQTGDLYVVTKRDGAEESHVFRFPQPLYTTGEVELIPVADLPVPKEDEMPLTGGDIHPSGTALLLRTRDRLYLASVPSGQPFEAAFTASWEKIWAADEPQGEAVAWLPSGTAYVTASESSPHVLTFSDCP